MHQQKFIAILCAVAVTSAVQADVQAASYQLKNGVLIDKKTKKVVKGYVLYKERLYYNGKLNKGYVVYKNKLYKNSKKNVGYAIVGIGNDMRLYYNTKLKKGTKKARNNTLLFKDGVLLKGIRQTKDFKYIYRDGFLISGVYQTNDKRYLYINGKLSTKIIEIYARDYTLYLYEKGQLATGTKQYKEGTFVDGVLDPSIREQIVDGKLYVDGKRLSRHYLYNNKLYYYGELAGGLVAYRNVYYYQGEIANGTYFDVKYENGVAYPQIDHVQLVNLNTLLVSGQQVSQLLAEYVEVNGEKAVRAYNGYAANENERYFVLKQPMGIDEEATVTLLGHTYKVNVAFSDTQLTLLTDTFEKPYADQLTLQLGNVPKTVLQLKEEGYDIAFTSTEAIFDSGKTSMTGKLTSLVVGHYPVTVTIEKNGQRKTFDSEINIIEKPTSTEETIPYLLSTRHSRTDYHRITSNTLIVGEKAVVDMATFGAQHAQVMGKALQYRSSDKTVIDFETLGYQDARDEDSPYIVQPHLVAKKKGTATITLRAGNYTKKIKMKVVTGKRKLTKVVAPKTKVMHVKSYFDSFEVYLYDQYGDPFVPHQTFTAKYAKTLTPYYTLTTTFKDTAILFNSFQPKKAGETGNVVFYDHQGKVLAKTKIITKALPPKEKLAFQENSLNWYWTDKGGTYAGEVTKKDVKG